MAALGKDVKLWTNRRIPYIFADGYAYRGEVLDAMKLWEDAAGVIFYERTDEKNYVEIITKQGSSESAIGMIGGKQIATINGEAHTTHELGHVLGLIHEQSRLDRDQYILVEWDYIAAGSIKDFEVDEECYQLSKYDLKSVMHYPSPTKTWGLKEKYKNEAEKEDKKFFTMRWKTDQGLYLGAHYYQGIAELSESDKIYVRQAYNNIGAPMGKEIEHGYWDYPYEAQFMFSVGGQQFLYGQNKGIKNKNNWFIRYLKAGVDKNGETTVTMDGVTDGGTWSAFYAIQFPFTIEGRVYFYGQHMEFTKGHGYRWFIQELLPYGKMGPKETASGYWNNLYEVQYPISVGDKQYFFGQHQTNNNKPKYWFIQELLPGGKMGEQTDSGYWRNFYKSQFSFTVENRAFIYGQSLEAAKDGFHWFIQEVLPGGKMSPKETSHGVWSNPFEVQFPYNINGKQYFYGQNLKRNYWFIQSINDNGTMGKELRHGFWTLPYSIQLPFQIEKAQFFYGSNLGYRLYWFIQRLHEEEAQP